MLLWELGDASCCWLMDYRGQEACVGDDEGKGRDRNTTQMKCVTFFWSLLQPSLRLIWLGQWLERGREGGPWRLHWCCEMPAECQTQSGIMLTVFRQISRHRQCPLPWPGWQCQWCTPRGLRSPVASAASLLHFSLVIIKSMWAIIVVATPAIIIMHTALYA